MGRPEAGATHGEARKMRLLRFSTCRRSKRLLGKANSTSRPLAPNGRAGRDEPKKGLPGERRISNGASRNDDCICSLTSCSTASGGFRARVAFRNPCRPNLALGVLQVDGRIEAALSDRTLGGWASQGVSCGHGSSRRTRGSAGTGTQGARWQAPWPGAQVGLGPSSREVHARGLMALFTSGPWDLRPLWRVA